MKKIKLKNYRLIYLLFVLVLSLVSFSLFPAQIKKVSANAVPDNSGCNYFGTNENYFFDDYETHDYVNGFLEIHLKLKTPYNDGRDWTSTEFYLFDSSCYAELQQTGFNPTINIDAGVQLYSVRFSSATHYALWNDENNTMEQCASCSEDIRLNLLNNGHPVTSISFQGNIDGGNYVATDSFPIVQPAPALTPILVIPGILGTELSYNGQVEWPNMVMTAITDDSFMDDLEMDEKGNSLNPITVGNVIQSQSYLLGTYHYVDGVISALQAKGYVLNQNLFLFSYDWRKDPKDIFGDLQNEINNIIQNNPNPGKVNILAHSYGGLVLKSYLKQTSDVRINKIVFAGVPHLGTPEAALALLFGSDLGIPVLNSGEIYKIAQNMPMIYDLLPNQEYFNHNPGYFDDLTDLKSPVIPDYQSLKSMLLDLGKNLNLLNQSELSHTDDLDNMDFSKTSYGVYNLTGCGLFTLKTIEKMYSANPSLVYRALHGPKYRIEGDTGDGTVVLGSSQHVSGATQYYLAGVAHAQMLADAGSSSAIAELLTGGQPQGLLSSPDSSCSISGKLLSFSSSVDLKITDKSTGKILQPRSDYGIINLDGDQNVFIPSDKLATYEVDISEDQSTPQPSAQENISVKNVNTQNNPDTTYNYNDLNVGTAELKMDFPNSSSADQNLTSTDGNGNTSDITPSQELDGSYNQIGGTTDNDSSSNTSDGTTQIYAPTSSSSDSAGSATASDDSQTLQQSTPDDHSQNPPDQTSSDQSADSQSSDNQTGTDDQQSDQTGDQTTAEQPVSKAKPQNINVTLELPKEAIQPQPGNSPVVQTINDSEGGILSWLKPVFSMFLYLLKLLLKA